MRGFLKGLIATLIIGALCISFIPNLSAQVGTITRRLIGIQDIYFATGGTGAAETFTYVDPSGNTLTLTKPDATHLKYRTAVEGATQSTENSVTAVYVADRYGAQTSATLTLALAAIGSDQATLKLLPGTWVISSDITIPTNVTLKPERGAILSVTTTKTLTINGSLDAGPYQIFSWTGTGKVTFGPGAVEEVYPQWFGAISGTGNDCHAAFTAVVASMRYGQCLRITEGVWRLATPFVLTTPITIAGYGSGSIIYADVGATQDCLTIGNGVNTRMGFTLRDFAILGAASSCKNALVLDRALGVQVQRLTLLTGAVEYALVINDSIYCNFSDINIHTLTYAGSTWTRPANGVKISDDLVQSNQIRMNGFAISTLTGNGLYISGVPNNHSVIEFSGSIEACGGYSVYAKNTYYLNLHDIYASDGNVGGNYFEECTYLALNNFKAAYTNLPTAFVNCEGVNLTNCGFGALSIDADCSKVVFNGTTGIYTSISDAGTGTIYNGPVYSSNATYKDVINRNAGTGDFENLISNASMERWQADRPDTWGKTAATTWTKCGTGLADTTAHWASYSAQSSVNAVASNTLTISASAINQLKGYHATFSAWVYHAAGQSPSAYPYFRIRIVDGTNKDYFTYSTPLSVATDDTWSKVYVGIDVPATATDVQITFTQNVPVAGGTNVAYVAEPTLIINWGAATSYINSIGSNELYCQVGALQIRADAYMPSNASSRYYTTYSRIGDVCWNDGSVTALTSGNANYWRCTVAGTPGTWIVGNTVP